MRGCGLIRTIKGSFGCFGEPDPGTQTGYLLSWRCGEWRLRFQNQKVERLIVPVNEWAWSECEERSEVHNRARGTDCGELHATRCALGAPLTLTTEDGASECPSTSSNDTTPSAPVAAPALYTAAEDESHGHRSLKGPHPASVRRLEYLSARRNFLLHLQLPAHPLSAVCEFPRQSER